jgi:hypothetical protein
LEESHVLHQRRAHGIFLHHLLLANANSWRELT